MGVTGSAGLRGTVRLASDPSTDRCLELHIDRECRGTWASPSEAEMPGMHLLLALPRPKVMRRLWAPLASIGVASITVTGATKVEGVYFSTGLLDTPVVRAEVLRGLEQAGDPALPEIHLSRGLRGALQLAEQLATGQTIGDLPWGVSRFDLLGGSGPPTTLEQEKRPQPLGDGPQGNPRRSGKGRIETGAAISAAKGGADEKGVLRLVADPAGTRSAIQEALQHGRAAGIPNAPCLLAVGPEGGWTPEELELLVSRGFHPVSVGSRPLTAETFAPAFLAMVSEAVRCGAGSSMD